MFPVPCTTPLTSPSDSDLRLKEKVDRLESVVKAQEQRIRVLESGHQEAVSVGPDGGGEGDLTERERKVMQFIISKPNVTKQDVVDHFKGEIARVPVFNTIDTLVRCGIIVDNPDSKNRQVHRLVANDTSTFLMVLLELKEFEDGFMKLVQKINQKRDKLYVPHPNRLPDEYFELTILGYRLFESMLQSYITRYIGIWPKEFRNKKDVLNKLILIVFNRIAGWKEQLPKIDVEGTDYFGDQFMIFRLRGTEYLKSFYDESKRLGISEEMETMLDALWMINLDVQIYAYPEPRLFSWKEFEYYKDSWRKLLEVADKHPEDSLFKMKKMPIDGLLSKPLEITKTAQRP